MTGFFVVVFVGGLGFGLVAFVGGLALIVVGLAFVSLIALDSDVALVISSMTFSIGLTSLFSTISSFLVSGISVDLTLFFLVEFRRDVFFLFVFLKINVFPFENWRCRKSID